MKSNLDFFDLDLNGTYKVHCSFYTAIKFGSNAHVFQVAVKDGDLGLVQGWSWSSVVFCCWQSITEVNRASSVASQPGVQA